MPAVSIFFLQTRGVAANCPWVGKKFGLGGGSYAEKRGSFFPNVFFISILFDLQKLLQILSNSMKINMPIGAEGGKFLKIVNFFCVFSTKIWYRYSCTDTGGEV